MPPADENVSSTSAPSSPPFSPATYPQNVGILGMEIYFPKNYVSQESLEKFDGVSAGKYTIGLGQTKMGFCADNEDIHSIALNVVSSLMKKYNISPLDVGRLEVGTETILDKSKSCKSVLMDLFVESGNTDIEGIDTTNACYGGTNALINTISWIESSYWDGRYGLVVMGDIAVYDTVAARPTGGAAIVAVLVGPNAPMVFDRGLRASHMENVYDFYKPDPTSEYPAVDGKLSNSCYLRAVDRCFTKYSEKFNRVTGDDFSLEKADYFVFHTPYVKLVQKSIARLCFMEFLRNPDREEFKGEEFQKYRHVKPEETYFDAELEKVFRKVGDPIFKKKAIPSTIINTNVGNSYCGSTYASLLSLISNVPEENLIGKRVLLFSYGSGLAATMFSLKINSSISHILKAAQVMERLGERTEVSPEKYVEIMKLRDLAHGKKSYSPVSGDEHILPGCYYLKAVDDKFRRSYAIKQ